MENKCITCTTRGVPIIGSAEISATDIAFFTISVSVQNSRSYRYLYSINSLYINGLYIGFLHYPCGCLVAVAYCSLYNKCYATLREAINTRDSSYCCWKAYQSLKMKQLYSTFVIKRRVSG